MTPKRRCATSCSSSRLPSRGSPDEEQELTLRRSVDAGEPAKKRSIHVAASSWLHGVARLALACATASSPRSAVRLSYSGPTKEGQNSGWPCKPTRCSPHRQHCDRAAIRTGQDDTAVRQRQHLVLVAVDETDLVGRRIHPAAALVEFPDICTDRPSVRCPLHRAAEGLQLRHRVVAAKQAQAQRPMPVRRAESRSRVRPQSQLSGTTRPGRRPSRVRPVRAARVRAGSP